MKRGLLKAATSLTLILLIALGTRVMYAWNQERQMRADLVGLAPFLNETGNIAYSLAAGHGFSSPYWQETRTNGLADACVPSAGRGDFQDVRDSYAPFVFCDRFSEHFVFHGDLRAGLLHRQTRGRVGVATRRGVAVGDFSQRDHDSLRMGLGHVARRAADGYDLVGDAGTRRYAKRARLVRIRIVMGICIDD